MSVKKLVSMITSLALAASVSFSVMTADIVYANDNNGVVTQKNSASISSDSTNKDYAEPCYMDNSYVLPNDNGDEMLYSSDSDYRQWAQGDSRWSGLMMGNPGSSVGGYGCLATAVTKLIIQCGLRSSDTFDVGTFVQAMNAVGGFDSGGGMYWAGPSNAVSGFNYADILYSSSVKYDSTDYEFTNNVITWINQGYHLVIALPYSWTSNGLAEVSYEGHWVAVDEAMTLSTGQVYIMDSLSNTSANADVLLTSRYRLHYRVLRYSGGTTPSITPSSDIVINNFNIPYAITAGDNVPLTGIVSSGYELSSLSVRVVDATYIGTSQGCIMGGDYNLATKSYDLSNLGMNFSGLKPGVYKITIRSSNAEKSKTLIEQLLTVLAPNDTGLQGTYTLRSAVDNSYVIGTGSNNNIQLRPYANTADRTWYIEHLENGYYTIRNCASGLYFDVYSGGTAAGTNIWQYDLNKSYAQQWQILSSGGTYYLLPRNSLGCAADVDYALMEDGTNIALYYTDLFMGANQRFVLDKSDCNFNTGHKITFDVNGGTIPSVANTHTANGVNTGRGLGDLVVYNVPGITVNTNSYGIEAQVDKTGKVTKIRNFGFAEQLTVPEGGMVISGHQNSGNDGGNFVSSISVGDYVGYDYNTKVVSVYKSLADYTANHKYLNNNDTYGTLPTPSRSDYIFDGWYTAASGGTKITSASTYTSSTLYAHWVTPKVAVYGKYTYTGNPIIPNVIVTIGSDTDFLILEEGTDYTVTATNNINAGTANYTVKAGGNYKFADITGTFTIEKAKASVTTAPTEIGGLKYDGTSKALVTAGTAANGTMVYSTDGVTYSSSIPTATAAGTYTVYYKAEGSGNYTDSAIGKLAVTIGENSEIIKGISVSSQKLIVIYGYAGSTVSSRTVNVAFGDATVEMIEWMYANDTSCTLLADYVNAFTSKSSSYSYILTEAQVKAIEYVLDYDFGN